jgi:hypothetical protein
MTYISLELNKLSVVVPKVLEDKCKDNEEPCHEDLEMVVARIGGKRLERFWQLVVGHPDNPQTDIPKHDS